MLVNDITNNNSYLNLVAKLLLHVENKQGTLFTYHKMPFVNDLWHISKDILSQIESIHEVRK
jgi:hypothetical protein